MKLNESNFSEEILYELEPEDDKDEIELEFDLSPGDNMYNQSAISQLLSDLIKDEWEAIDGYTSAIVSCKELPDSDELVDVLNDILVEENVHIGQLERILQDFVPSAESIEDGEQEAEETLLNTGETNDEVNA